MPRCRNRTKYSLGKDFLVVRKSVPIAIARVLSEVRSYAFIRIQLERNTYRVTFSLTNSLSEPVTCTCFFRKPVGEDPVPSLTA